MPCLPLIDLSSVSHAQNYNLASFQIEDDAIITDAKSVGAQFRLLERLGVLERIGFVTEESFPYALLYLQIKRIDIPDRPVCVDQPVFHRPKTSWWGFTFPVLKSRRASRML